MATVRAFVLSVFVAVPLVVCLGITAAEAGIPRSITAFNKCDDGNVKLTVRVRIDGVWRTVPAGYLGPNGRYRLVDKQGRTIKTDNRTIYFHAEGNRALWTGSNRDDDRSYKIDGQLERFRRYVLREDGSGNHLLRLECQSIDRKLLDAAISDRDVPQRTELRIVYKPFKWAWLLNYKRYPHVMVVAVDPNNPGNGYYTDAGKAKFKRMISGRDCRRSDQLCAQVRNATTVLKRWRNQQTVYVNLPFNEVVRRMEVYAKATNQADLPFKPLSQNCAVYVFSFLREALDLHVRPKPRSVSGGDIRILGWSKTLGIPWRRVAV